MTIAIGMLCAEGVVIAADQASTMGDGSQSVRRKVDANCGTNCSFAVAHSADDGNAALTLQDKMVCALSKSDPFYVSQAEEIIVEQMSSWAAAWATPPNVEFLIGFCGKGMDIENPGPVLLYASPPNTLLRRYWTDDSNGYDAIGSGSAVTNPLHAAFLTGRGTAQHTLSKIAYLMDKAKRGNMYCGGRTNAVIVRQSLGFPDWISPSDMEVAERNARHLDFYLQWTGSCFFGQNDEGVGQLADGLADAIKAGQTLRNLRFRTLSGVEIYDTSVQAPGATEESAGS
jgi:hypothetical protein